MARASIKDDMNNLLGNLGGLSEGDVGLGAGGGVSMGGVLAGALSAIVGAALNRDEIPGWRELRDKYFNENKETNNGSIGQVQPGTDVITGGKDTTTGNEVTGGSISNNIESVAPETTVKPEIKLPNINNPEINEPITENVQNGDYTWNTDGNIQGVDLGEWKKWYEDMRDDAWTREDYVRDIVHQREDNAWQRAVADMRAAGINPNLVNAGPAQAGGGVTNATMGDSSPLVSALTTNGDLLERMLEQAFEGDENSKNRVMELITQIVGSVAQLMGAKMLSGK